jgi:uncharacterized membrane protein
MSNNLTLASILNVNSSARTREESFGIMIASRTTPAVCLNEDAILIWNLCNGKNTLKTIIDKLIQDFPAENKKEAEGKITKVIKTLLNFKLIAIVN